MTQKLAAALLGRALLCLGEATHLSLGFWGPDKPFQQKKGDTGYQHPVPCSDTDVDVRHGCCIAMHTLTQREVVLLGRVQANR